MDKFGYYFAGGIKTYSKLEARQLGGATFHFNDEVFSSIDTKKEPDASLWTLYMARAKQIREAYDYVVIMYSGGSDSHNVLDAFIAADCKIDELCTTWDYETTGLSQSFHNAEATNVVLPRIKQLKQQGIDFRFRTVDLSPLIVQAFTKLGNQFEYFVNHHMSPNNVAKHFLREHVKEWADLIAQGKKLVLVWGSEKPCMLVHNNEWFFNFKDNLDNCVGPYCYRPGWNDEMFYWTPDMPELVIKQAHMVKNWCNTHREYNEYKSDSPEFYQEGPTQGGWGSNVLLNKFLTYDQFKHILYPTWNSDIYCNGKAYSMIYSKRDTFFLQGNHLIKRYHEIVDSYFNQLGDKTPTEKRQTLPPMFTRNYPV